ncbi:FAD-dependent oxidoreductase [Salipaludibacillus keqinensis]|uniref:FAD-dependent oxidoreductase n=1 Tax=Salipaludibacillus keqinensis TaxID=2045207 RepID=A0A323T8V5_9BACI|nr:FAD-dependent oxidoreductase [Salipaludibacillus keqinensis]PYZ91636.1 FAD-dependent oxidoreductase [Salipaludibacillus keqinensis]
MNRHDTHGSLPKEPSSYWIDSTTFDEPKPLSENIKTDVAIVGAGITGITAAYLLAKEGVNVVLLEANRVLQGTTGHTTAKITAQHGLIYDELIHHIGEESARLYFDVNERAREFIERTIQENVLDCDLEKHDAVLYAVSKKSAKQLKKEIRAYEKLNIPHSTMSKLPYDVQIDSALAMKNQAQFHPLHYLTFLLNEFKKMGGTVYEQTPVVNMSEGETPIIQTRDGFSVTTRFALSCSHFPFYDGDNYFFSRLYAERSYVLAVEGERMDGMYLSVDSPKRSVRSATINGTPHLLIGGESHKTGQGEPTMHHYEALQSFANETFGSTSFPYRWSAQDLYTLDHLPYVGILTDNNFNTFLATGYRKWGMTSGTAAAFMLKDYVLEKETDEMALFDPNRFLIDPSLKNFLQQNMDVAKHFFVDKLKPAEKLLKNVKIGEGAIVSKDGSRAGAYRDEQGELHIVDSTCTHLGCEVEWNNGDRTWDCPCHGSRFSYDGTVIEGPADEPLKQFPK